MSETDGLAPPTLPPLTGPVPAAVFVHAPSQSDGWTLASACRMEELPALTPTENSCGQRHWTGQLNTVSLERAEGAGNFLRIGFPSGSSSSVNYGGGSPSAFTMSGSLPENTGHLYMGQYMRWSTNWWHPANEGHKTIYLVERDATTAHFFAWVDNTSVNAGTLLFKFGTQWVNNQGSPYVDEVWTDNEPSNALEKGSWHLVEYLITPNTPGNRDGRLQAWVDGELVKDVTRLPLFRPGATHRWSGIWFSPIYASTGRMPPADQYFDLSHLRIMVK